MNSLYLARLAAVAVLVLGCAAPVHAAVTADTLAQSYEGITASTPDKDSDPTSSYSSQTSLDGFAEANATISGSTTSVGARVTGDTTDQVSGVAAAAVTESFTYVTDGVASYTLEVDGTVSTGGLVVIPFLIVAAGQDLGPIDLETLDLTSLTGEGFGFTEELVSGTYSTSTIEFPHAAGVPTEITFLLAVLVSAIEGNYDLDFFNTVTVTASSKTDFVSGSGNLYNASIAIPTPSAAAMIPVAMVGLLARRRRR